MAKSAGKPHILVAVDLSLTRAVYDRLDGFPIIVTQNPLLLSRPEPPTMEEHFLRRRARMPDAKVYPLSLDAHMVEGSSWLLDLDGIMAAMETAREDFGLEDEPVVAAVVGNEGALRAALKAQDLYPPPLLNRFLLDELIRNGRAAAFLGAVLSEVAGLELRYLAHTVDWLTPPPSERDYRELIDRARELVSKLEPIKKVRDSTRFSLGVPATPYLFVSKGGGWSLLPVDGDPYEGLGSATSRAIETFRRERQTRGPWLRGVLVNVLSEDLSRHSPADPPYVSLSERQRATDAGLEAILLDDRVGIACPTEQEFGFTPVYGALLHPHR